MTNPRTAVAVPQFGQTNDSGKALAALLIYLVAFVLTLFLFVRGFHSLALVVLFAVWAVLAVWLQKGDR